MTPSFIHNEKCMYHILSLKESSFLAFKFPKHDFPMSITHTFYSTNYHQKSFASFCCVYLFTYDTTIQAIYQLHYSIKQGSLEEQYIFVIYIKFALNIYCISLGIVTVCLFTRRLLFAHLAGIALENLR